MKVYELSSEVWKNISVRDDSLPARLGVLQFGGDSKPAGNTTTVQTSTPWAEQAPYLKEAFSGAEDLYKNYNPQYYGDSTVAGFTPGQRTALDTINTLATNGSPVNTSASNFNADLLNGSYMGSNPAMGYFGNLAGDNVGLNNPGAAKLGQLQDVNAGLSGPWAGRLNNLSATNYGTANTGDPSLQKFSGGDYVNSDISDISQSIFAQVAPQIQAQFAHGHSLNNPLAARATSEGVTSALAPVLANMRTTERGQQLGAAQDLATNTLTGAQNQGYLAKSLGDLGLGGAGLQVNAASNLTNSANAGAANQINATKGMADAYQGGVDSRIKGLALAPQTSGLRYDDASRMFSAGSADQGLNQQQLDYLVNKFNFGQTLPYDKLSQFIGDISGNYGGTSTMKQPYFQNQTANALGTGAGALALASQVPWASLLAFL